MSDITVEYENPLYLIRMETDPDQGLRCEDVTRKRLELEWARYCGIKLAQMLLWDKLRVYAIQLDEFGEAVQCRVLLDKAFALNFSSIVGETKGYKYYPQWGGGEGFGYYSNTPCWIWPHHTTPAILYSAVNKDAEALAMRWLDHYCTEIEEGRVNPATIDRPSVRVEALNEYVIPEEYKAQMTTRNGRRRFTSGNVY